MSTSRATRRTVLYAATAAAGVGAALAPAALTGSPVIDAVERALVAATVAFVGAHGRRWTWIAAAGVVAVPARGTALALTLAALAVLVPAVSTRRRSKDVGAIGLGLLANVPFWYSPGSLPWSPVLALAAFALLVGSGRPFLRRHRRRALHGGLVAASVVVALAVVGLGAALLLARSSATRGASDAQRALDEARAGDGEGAAAAILRADEELEEADRHVSGLLSAPARLVPGLAQQAHAVRAALHEAGRVSGVASDLVQTADYDRLRYQGRLDLEQVRALRAPTEATHAVLVRAGRELEATGRGWLVGPLGDRIDDFARQVADAERDTDLARRVLDVAPALFGDDADRRYLVVFVTPAELRGAGGFIGSFAELTAREGEVDLTRSGRIRELIEGAAEGTRTIQGPADYVARYGSKRPEDFLQDVTLSPDFPSVGDVLRQLYPQSGGAEVDGVIGVDPRGLAALLELTGPVRVPGLRAPLGPDNAEEVLLRSQYLEVPDEAERGDILTEAVRLTFEELTEGRLPAPRAVADALSAPTREGHLRLWSPAEREQALFTYLGADGRLALPAMGDGFSVVQQNVGNNKLDAYLQRTIAYDATVDAATGELRARLTIELRNEVPSTDLPRPVVGNSRGAPVGTNLATITVYSRHRLVSATLDGAPTTLGPARERGLHAYDTTLLRIAPGRTTALVLELRGGLDLASGYDLRILPQPVANPDVVQATLTVRNGQVTGRGPGAVTVVPEAPLRRRVDRHVDVHR